MPTIKENLTVLRAAIVAYPEHKLSLKHYHTCGTIFCAAGLAATMPYFTNQIGVEPPDPKKDSYDISDIASTLADLPELWGEDSFLRLFHVHHSGCYDSDLREDFYKINSRYPNDKELILLRLDHALQHHV